MSNIKKILQESLSKAAASGDRTRSGTATRGLGTSGLESFTRDAKGQLNELGKELEKAISDKNLKRINSLMKSMSDAKGIQNVNKNIERYEKLMEKLGKREGPVTAKDNLRMAEAAQKLSVLKEKAKELNKAFDETNQTLSGKLMGNLKDLAKNKWTGFAAGATSAGFFANAIRNVDKAAVFTQASVDNMTSDEAARRWANTGASIDAVGNTFKKGGESAGIFGGMIDGTLGSFKTFGSRIGTAVAGTAELNKEHADSIKLQRGLRALTMETGKSYDELSESALTLMDTFKISADRGEDIVKMTKATEQLGAVTRIGAAGAMQFFEKRVKGMGEGLESAQLEMAGMVGAAEDLQRGVETANVTTKDFTRSVMDSVNADDRASQNIRMKTHLLKGQLAVMMSLGQSQEEAMKNAQNAVATATKGSDYLEAEAGTKMAQKMNRDILDLAEIKDVEEKEKKKKEIYAKYTIGMTEDKRKATEKWLDHEFEMNKNGIDDTFSYGKVLREKFGSEVSGTLELAAQQFDKYSDKDRSTAVNLMASNEGMTREVASARFDAMKSLGKDGYLKSLIPSETDSKGRTEADTLSDIGDKAHARNAADPIGGLEKSFKELVNDPLVSTVLGAGAGAAAIASMAAASGANTFALWANTKALATKGLGAAGDLVGKIGKGGKLMRGLSMVARLANPVGKVAAAGAAGYAVGTMIDKAAPTTANRYGQSSNIFERGMAKVAMSKEEYEDAYGETPIAAPGAPASALVPKSAPQRAPEKTSAAPGGQKEVSASFQGGVGDEVLLKISGFSQMVAASQLKAVGSYRQ